MPMTGSLFDALRPVRFRGKARLLGPLVPHSGRRVARVFGFRMTLDLADHAERMIYLGAYEREETALVLRWLRPGMTFLDVGANIGYFSLLAAQRVGQAGRVIAVEPSLHVFAQLDRTLRDNDLPVERHPIGLSDSAGECTLFLPDEAMPIFSPTMVAHSGSGRSVVVPVRRLDDCLEAWGVAAVDLMKIDVEGHEGKVFAGAGAALSSGRIRAVLCEFNDFWLRAAGSSPAALFDQLTAAGFVDQGGPPRFDPGCVVNRFLVHRAALG